MEFTTEQILFIAAAALVFSLIIIYLIIQSATKSSSILKLQRMQVELLREIALQNGVEAEKVNEIISKHNE
ncbi:MAG TPA: hypothetical protein VI548_03900 [Chitinophagaceae bacterium]|nr:hypothetical protein [Chitinophagaceae bacterium]